jgi:hypothetical protein
MVLPGHARIVGNKMDMGTSNKDVNIVELFHPNQYLVFDNKSQTSNADILNVYGHIPGINFTIIT